MTAAVTRGARAPIRVLVVIVSYRTAGLTIACLKSLQDEVLASRSIRVAVIDNASGDAPEIAAAIAAHGWGDWAELVVAPRNGGFSYGNNRGLEIGLGWPEPPDYFFLLNADTEARGPAIGALADFLDAHPDVGIAGSSFENPDGSDWPHAFRFPGIASQFEQGVRLGIVSRLLKDFLVPRVMGRQPEQVDWVAGAAMMIRRRVVEDIGPMDEGYFLYFEEVDYCLQARRAGWPCWYVPQSRVMHICGQSTGVSTPGQNLRPLPDYWFASRSRYFVKNHGIWYARGADLAFAVGLALRLLRQRLTGLHVAEPPGLLRDLWRTSVLFLHGAALRRRIGETVDG
jgi:hypothetical protein